MSYQTGPSASPVALLDTFVTFLVAAGWVQDANTADGTGKRAHLHKGAKYIHLRSFINENDQYTGGGPGSGIAITVGTAYAGANPWWRQANTPFTQGGDPNVHVWTGVMATPPGAIQNYWMFADAAGDNCFLVALKQSGVYSYIGFGELIKPQAYTGGGWFVAPRYCGGFTGGQNGHGAGEGVTTQSDIPASFMGFFKADVDSWVGRWNILSNTTPVGFNVTPGKRVNSTTGQTVNGDNIFYGAFRLRARSERTGALILLPTLWLVDRDFGGALSGGGWSLVGQVPDIFQTKTTGFVPGSQYNISTDQYIVFPDFVIRKYP